MPDSITPPSSKKEQLTKLYAKLGHIRARLQQMGPDQAGRAEVYQKEAASVAAQIKKIKGE